jgi:hypothetical protein
VTTEEVTVDVVRAGAGGDLPCTAFVFGAAVPAIRFGVAAGATLSTMMPDLAAAPANGSRSAAYGATAEPTSANHETEMIDRGFTPTFLSL